MHATAIAHLSRVDRVLARHIRRIGDCGLKPRRHHGAYRALVQAVIYQQLHGAAAASILARFRALFPGKAFPQPADILALGSDKMRSAGLSRAKAAAILDIAASALNGIIPRARTISRMEDEEIVTQLTRIRGVGPWTVEMLLIFTLGRPDVLPVTDFGVRKGYARLYALRALPTSAELLAQGDRWRPHRSVAAWYLWRAADLPE